jgi:hypothetical protein
MHEFYNKNLHVQILQRSQLSFKSNHTLNIKLDSLPAAGPEWVRVKKKAVGDLKGPDGKLLTEKYEMWCWNAVVLVRELIGNSMYGAQLVFGPKMVFANAQQTEQRYDELWMADWWFKVQVSTMVSDGVVKTHDKARHHCLAMRPLSLLS